MNQYKIKKNSLQETLIIPFYARWLCSQKFPGLFQDETAGEREENLAFDLTDPNWMKAIRFDPENGAVLFAAGVFYYFTANQMKQFAKTTAGHFPGGCLVFDAAGKTAVKLMLKTWVKQAGIKDVGAYFSVKDAKESRSVGHHCSLFPAAGICRAIRNWRDRG